MILRYGFELTGGITSFLHILKVIVNSYLSEDQPLGSNQCIYSKIESSLYSRCYAERSGGDHFRCFALGQHSSKETSQRLRHFVRFDPLGLELQVRINGNVLTTDLTDRVQCIC